MKTRAYLSVLSVRSRKALIKQVVLKMGPIQCSDKVLLRVLKNKNPTCWSDPAWSTPPGPTRPCGHWHGCWGPQCAHGELTGEGQNIWAPDSISGEGEVTPLMDGAPATPPPSRPPMGHQGKGCDVPPGLLFRSNAGKILLTFQKHWFTHLIVHTSFNEVRLRLLKLQFNLYN